MRYARLGKSGLIVSQLAWGAANVGTPLPQFAVKRHLDESTVGRAAAQALDAGINFFDTADLYSNGEAEEILGRVISPHRRDIVLSTKVGLRTGEAKVRAGLSRRHILASVDDSLRRLGTDWIDIYIAHKVDPLTPLEETLEALDKTVRSGKVRYLGYSNWPAWLVAKSIEIQRRNGWAEFVTGQMYYSLVGREAEQEIIPQCKDAGIGLMVWSPLAGGYLSGKHSGPAPAAGDETFLQFVPLDRTHADRVVTVLREVAAQHRVTAANVAMAWLFDRPAVSTVLIGISRIEQMEENLRAALLVLSDDDIKALEEVSRIPDAYPGWYNQRMTDATALDGLKR